MKRFFPPILPLLASLFLLACLMLGAASCKKDTLLKSGGDLKFSTDTLAFDTVFTAAGSFTLQMKIYNPQNQRITLTSVRMAGGAASPFHLNVDGFAGNNVTNIEIAANDSAYVFATVNIDPTNADNPFIITDNLVASLNGRDFTVPFTAYGQNAHYIKGTDLATVLDYLHVSGKWGYDDNKPYVLIKAVGVGTGESLQIKEGTRLYMHADARLFIQGTLNAIGTKADSIIFQGDRLDRAYFGYEGYPGEWGGIYFDSLSTGNLTHVILQNGGNGAQGTVAALLQVSPTGYVHLDKCTIRNSIGYGIFSYGGNLRADNSLIHDCGAQALAIVRGGNDTLKNCTIALYGNGKINHIDNATAIILDYYKPDDMTTYTAPLSAAFSNCVMYGSLDNEVIVDNLLPATTVSFDHCLLKMDASKMPSFVIQQGVKYNIDPMFVNTSKWDYHAKPGSPLIDSGAVLGAGLAHSLDEISRPQGGGWDIGCYEQ